jgi:hypothetical protein
LFLKLSQFVRLLLSVCATSVLNLPQSNSVEKELEKIEKLEKSKTSKKGEPVGRCPCLIVATSHAPPKARIASWKSNEVQQQHSASSPPCS